MKPKHVYQIVIQTTNSSLWNALINPEITGHYFFGLSVKSELAVGSKIEYMDAAGNDVISGEILEYEPLKRIVYSFRGHETENGKRDPFSRVSFEIEPINANACTLTVVHDGFESENTTYNAVGNGWPTILSGLKTLLETGKPLQIEVDTDCGE